MRAAIYIRVSTDRQVDGVSLENQERLCIDRLKELGYRDGEYDIFREEGISGEDIDIRPEMTRLRELASEGVYKHIACYHPDRFSRDMTDKLIVCREFEKHGTELVFADVEYENSPEGRLFFNIMSSIAEYEHGLIKKRTISGRVGRVRNHKEVMPMRIPPYGYDWKDKELIINEEEAKYVRLIYQWYVFDKLTLREIGEKLFKHGAMPKRKESKYWNASSISRILKSELYVGRYYYNRRKTKKVRGEVTKSGKPKKTYETRDRKDWLLVEIPTIIDEEVWNLAQKQRNKNRTNSGNVKNEYLLKSLLFCKNCGRRWNGTFYTGRKDENGIATKYFAYRCPNKNPKKYGDKDLFHDCKRNSIRADLLERHIWEEVVLPIIKNPKRMSESLDKKQSNSDDGIEQEMKMLEKTVKNKKEEKNRIKKMFQLGVIEEHEMLQDMKKVNDEIKDIEYDISLLESKQKAKISTNTKKDMLKSFAKKYATRVESNEDVDFDLKRDIITSFIDRIDITICDDNEVDIDISGAIEALIEKDSAHIVSSTQRLDVINTIRRMEMLIKSRFSLEKILNEGRYRYDINKDSIESEFILK